MDTIKKLTVLVLSMLLFSSTYAQTEQEMVNPLKAQGGPEQEIQMDLEKQQTSQIVEEKRVQLENDMKDKEFQKRVDEKQLELQREGIAEQKSKKNHFLAREGAAEGGIGPEEDVRN